MTIQANQGLSLQLGSSWQATQSLLGQMYLPIHGAVASSTNKNLALTVDVAHEWQRDQASLNGRLGVMQSTAQTEPELTTTLNSEFVQPGLGWTHEWTPELSHALTSGVVFMRVLGQTSTSFAVSASAAWHSLGRQIALHAGQSADVNVYVGSAYERRFVTLSLGLPANRSETLQMSADANLEHDTTAATSNAGVGSADVFFGHGGLHWNPGGAFVYGLEYIFRDQRASSGDSGLSPLASFRSQTAMLTIAAHYPSRS